jgi:MFS family permease
MGNGLGQIFLGGLIQNFGWRFGFLLPISIAIGCTLIPLFRIYFNEKEESEKRN